MSETHPPTSVSSVPESAVRPAGLLIRQFAVLLPFLGVFGLAFGWPSSHWAVRIAWVLWTSYFLFCWTSVFHEVAHQTLPRPKWFNILMGRIIGTVLLTPYNVYRESHIRHHAYLNRPNDWELWPYSDPHCSLGFRRMFVWLDLVFGALTSPYIYGRIFFHQESPIQKPEIRRAILWEYVAIGVFWGAILTWVGWNGYWFEFLLAWVIPHWIAGLIQSGRKMTEHLGMSSFDPLRGTRTVLSRNPITRLASFLNFDIFVHGPHHRYPRISHEQLRGKMGEHLQNEPDIEFPVYQSYLAATRAMLPCLFLKPGVGLNAGATAANRVTQEDVSEFLEDVTVLVGGQPNHEAPKPE